jgi:hypothetical protein
MPQHPRYSNTPERNLERLYDLLTELVSFGFAHEEIFNYLDEIMKRLHSDAVSKYVKQEQKYRRQDDQDDDASHDEITFGLRACDLFEYISAKHAEQFIQDFRNALVHLLSSEEIDVDEISFLVEQERDPEYYKAHTYNEQDTKTLRRLDACQRSIWFPEEINPSIAGIYAISYTGYAAPKISGFAYWDTKTWYEPCLLYKECTKQRKTKGQQVESRFSWQGILVDSPTSNALLPAHVLPIPEN